MPPRANVTTRADFNRLKTVVKRTRKIYKKGAMTRLSGVAAYERKAIRNAIRDGGKRKKKGYELAVWTPEGKRLCSVAEFLAGAYRAIGHGKRTVRAWHDENRWIVAGRLSQKNQRKNAYIVQGTGRFDDKTRETIDKIRHRASTQAALRRQLALHMKLRDRYQRQAHYKTWTAEQREKAASEAAEQVKAIRQLKYQSKKLDKLALKKQIRIVARNRFDVPARDVQTNYFYRAASQPGEPPKTWGGKPLKKALYFQMVGDSGFYIFAAPRDGADVYKILEFGGTSLSGKRTRMGRNRGNLIGYIIESEREQGYRGRKFSHKRVSFSRKYGPREPIRIQPRPFFTPAIPRIKKRITEIFGPDMAAKIATQIR